MTNHRNTISLHTCHQSCDFFYKSNIELMILSLNALTRQIINYQLKIVKCLNNNITISHSDVLLHSGIALF